MFSFSRTKTASDIGGEPALGKFAEPVQAASSSIARTGLESAAVEAGQAQGDVQVDVQVDVPVDAAGKPDPAPNDSTAASGSFVKADSGAAAHLRALGLQPDATWPEVTAAYRRLVSDLTPGPDASHQNVQLAERFLTEVNQAYASLRSLAAA